MSKKKSRKGPDRSAAHKANRRTRRGYTARQVDVRDVQQRFLIVCEGEKTEPSEMLGVPYKKNDTEMYDRLPGRQNQAIRNATRLLSRYDPHRPERDNPCTSVHLLVGELI